jgi:hypothetical protein
MMARGLALLALGVFAFLATSASAQISPVNALREWGMLGWWSPRCEVQPSDSNLWYGFVVTADGRAYLERNFGGDTPDNDRSEIVSAKVQADGTLALQINFARFNDVRLNVYAKSEGRTRVMYNRGSKGDVSVERGVLRHNGQPTPWFNKCR